MNIAEYASSKNANSVHCYRLVVAFTCSIPWPELNVGKFELLFNV